MHVAFLILGCCEFLCSTHAHARDLTSTHIHLRHAWMGMLTCTDDVASLCSATTRTLLRSVEDTSPAIGNHTAAGAMIILIISSPRIEFQIKYHGVTAIASP